MENMPDNAKDNSVGKREALLADRLRLHKGYRHTGMKIFSKGDFTLFGKRGLVLQHGEDDVSSFTLNPSWLSCEDETQRCIMVEIYLEP